MKYRYEKRMVPTEQDIAVVDCDNCGKSVDVPKDQLAYRVPEGWVYVWSGKDWVFCSKVCLAQWASADGSTSAELTKIAREAFARTTGAVN